MFSGTVLLELARRGVTREDAYAWVQRNAMRARDERRDFKSLLRGGSGYFAVLTPAEIERAFDLAEQFRHIDHIFDRVFSASLARMTAASSRNR